MRLAVAASFCVVCVALVGCGSDASPASETPDTGLPESAPIDAFADGTSETPTDVSDAPPLPTKTVLRVHYPAGTATLSVRGSAGPWTWSKGVAMTAGADDTWTLETDAVTATTEWKPLLDDATWSRGPNYTVAPGRTVDVWPHFKNAQGKYEKRFTLTSTVLGNSRGVWVYLPPTALENPRAHFPVVYMHDGQNLFDAKTAFGGNEWKVDETLDEGAEDGTLREAIVVGPENTSERIAEYTPTTDPGYPGSGNAVKYLKMLTTELKPRIDAELPTLAGREDTAMVGSSLGGLVTAFAGTKVPETFALLGEMSPSTWWDGTVILSLVAATKGATTRPLRVYVDSGDSGPSADDAANTKLLAQTYRDLGYVDDKDLRYVLQKGAVHDETYWAQRLPGALRFLLGPRTP